MCTNYQRTACADPGATCLAPGLRCEARIITARGEPVSGRTGDIGNGGGNGGGRRGGNGGGGGSEPGEYDGGSRIRQLLLLLLAFAGQQALLPASAPASG